MSRCATLASRWLALPGNVRGAVWMTASALFAALSSALLKQVGTRLDPWQLIFVRALIGIPLLLPFVLRGPGGLRVRRPGLQLARALASLVGMVIYLAALQRLPLADVTVLLFTIPMFQIVLAVLFLGEMVRWRRGVATLAGFVGAAVVVQPTAGAFDPAYLLPLAAAFIFTVVQTLLKKLSAVDRPEMIALFSYWVSAPAAAVPAALAWVPPTPAEWALLAVATVLGTLTNLTWVMSLRVGEVTAVGPFDYTQLVWASLLGFIVFGELPGMHTWIGAAVIVAATLYMARRESGLARRQGEPA